MKKITSLFCALLVSLMVYLDISQATPIEVSTYWSSGEPYFTADLQYRDGTPYHYSNNSYVSPIILTLGDDVYSAYCIDLFDPLWSGVYSNYSIITIDQYMLGSYLTTNGHYNDPMNLEYALYNMEKNLFLLTGVREKSYAQLNLWNTLYDYYPHGDSGHENQFFDSNFFATDINRVTNIGLNPYDADFANFNTAFTGANGVSNNTYNTTVLNAISNGSYDDVKDMYRVIQFGSGNGIQEVVIRVGTTVPEPTTMLLLGFGLICVAGVSRKNITKD